MAILPQPHAPSAMVFLLSLIADDSVCVCVIEGEGSGKVVIRASRKKQIERDVHSKKI